MPAFARAGNRRGTMRPRRKPVASPTKGLCIAHVRCGTTCGPGIVAASRSDHCRRPMLCHRVSAAQPAVFAVADLGLGASRDSFRAAGHRCRTVGQSVTAMTEPPERERRERRRSHRNPSGRAVTRNVTTAEKRTPAYERLIVLRAPHRRFPGPRRSAPAPAKPPAVGARSARSRASANPRQYGAPHQVPLPDERGGTCDLMQASLFFDLPHY